MSRSKGALKLVCVCMAWILLTCTFPISVATADEQMTAESLQRKMDEICEKYGFRKHKYWSYNPSIGSKDDYTASDHKANTKNSTGEKGWYGYRFDNGQECFAFASFIGYELFHISNPQNGGWTKYRTIEEVKKHGLCVGDIIRTESKDHSAIVYSEGTDGSIIVLQVYGTQNNKIVLRSNFAGVCKTLDDFANNIYGNFIFVAHAPNNTSTPLWPKNLQPIEPQDLSIVTQPQNVVVEKANDQATTSVVATGDGLTYQWYRKEPGKEWGKSSKTTATYSLKVEKKYDGIQIYCVITDQYGNTATTDTVSLSIRKAQDPAYNPTTEYKVIYANGLRIRSAPGTSAGTVDVMKKDTQFWVDETSTQTGDGYTWAYSKLADGTTGWVAISNPDYCVPVTSCTGGRCPGDASGDGVVELDDIMLMIDYYCGLTTNVVETNCDLDNDGMVCDLPDIMMTIDIYCSLL